LFNISFMEAVLNCGTAVKVEKGCGVFPGVRYNPGIMTVYSYSRVNTYYTCPAQFDFRYQKKIPSPVAEGVELFMGSRFHETMEFLYQQIPQRVPTVNEVGGPFDAGWESNWKTVVQRQ